MFVMGAPQLTVVVDHKPLIYIFNDRELSSIENPRVRNFKEKTLMYCYDIIHMPGKSKVMKVSDIASRNPVNSDKDDTCEIAATAFAITQGDGIQNISWQTVNDHANHECSLLAEYIANGFPRSKEELPLEIRVYWTMKDDLFLIEGVPFKGRKMLIPASLRHTVLEGLHAAHQGVSSMLANARESMLPSASSETNAVNAMSKHLPSAVNQPLKQIHQNIPSNKSQQTYSNYPGFRISFLLTPILDG